MTADYRKFSATLGTLLSDGTQPATAAGTVPTPSTAAADSVAVTTAIDAAAAAIVAITGDTYSTTTKQMTFGGATGLTHAQVATVGALLNTAFAASLVVKAEFVGVAAGDVQITFDKTAVVTRSRLRQAIAEILRNIEGSDVLTP